MLTRRRVVFTAKPGAVRDELWTPQAKALAHELGFDITLNECSGSLAPDEWADFFAPADAIITTWGTPTLDEAVLARNASLRIVGHAAGSVANMVSDHLFDRGVHVVTANAEMARSVAEWSLMMTLVGARRVLEYSKLGALDTIDAGRRHLGQSPTNQTVGILGYGDIARRLVRMLSVVPPKRILVYANDLSAADAEAAGVTVVDLPTLFSETDVLHVLCSLTEETKGMIDAGLLERIKDSAVLINAGRAPIIQRDPLLCELRKERFAAILDVHYREPPPPGDPFRALPNVIMTPHCAGRTNRDRYVPLVLHEFARCFAGEPLEHDVSRARAVAMTNANLVRG